MPLNRELFAQRGGMAPFGSLDNGYLIDQAARVQAETYPLDQAVGELSTVIPKVGHESGPSPSYHQGTDADAVAVAKSGTQQGGRRSRSRSRSRKQKKQQKKQRQRQSRRQRSQKQKGGMFPIDADTMLLPRGTDAGFNSQFSNEAQVNNLYNEYSGPQGHTAGHSAGQSGSHGPHAQV